MTPGWEQSPVYQKMLAGVRADLAAILEDRPLAPTKLPDDPLNEFEATQKQVAALMTAWNKAGAEAREQFLASVDVPVFDNAAAA